MAVRASDRRKNESGLAVSIIRHSPEPCVTSHAHWHTSPSAQLTVSLLAMQGVRGHSDGPDANTTHTKQCTGMTRAVQ